MNYWNLIKVKFTKEYQDGTLKRVTEPYLLSAMSFTEAEARIYKEVGEFVRGEFVVKSISKQDIADIFHYPDADVWYKSKVVYISEDADTGKEKKANNVYMVSAHSVDEAEQRIVESLKGLMVEYDILKIEKTGIIEIFPYDPEQKMQSGEMKTDIVEITMNDGPFYGKKEDESE